MVVPRSTNAKRKTSNFMSILTHGMVGIVCFYIGLFLVTIEHSSQCQPCPACSACPVCVEPNDKAISQEQSSTTFPKSLQNFVHEYTTVKREDLNELLEVGVPLDDPKPGYKDALIIYPSPQTVPKEKTLNMNATTALKECMSVKLILQDAKPQTKQCLALLPQWESYHVHKFMRVPTEESRLSGRLAGEESPSLPLRYVSQSHTSKGTYTSVPELQKDTIPFYKILIEYYQNLDRIKSEIGPILKSLDSTTIITMVCNFGQSELLHNFVCNAKAKKLDLHQIFVFCTDEKTYTLAKSLGLAAYYDEAIFGDMPENAAGSYGDRTFAKMMMAKVHCVHLVLHCGYNVLFQDVDVIWYKHPLTYFDQDDPRINEWDLMFQDDGSRQLRYTPYSPNTGALTFLQESW